MPAWTTAEFRMILWLAAVLIALGVAVIVSAATDARRLTRSTGSSFPGSPYSGGGGGCPDTRRVS